MSEIIQTTGSTEDNVILFEVSQANGTLKSSKPNPAELATRSAQALRQAMGTIYALASRSHQVMGTLPNTPAEFELEFSIKIDADAGALISKNQGEGNLHIKLVWRDSEATES